jgi:hypothetical protein
MNKKVTVKNLGDKILRSSYWHGRLNQSYSYTLTEPTGRNFHPEFKPDLTPKEMLHLGVFGGVYFEDEPKEFPKSWFNGMKSRKDGKKHSELNCFGVSASQSHDVWKKNGWINMEHDPRGWFEWYCRYYLGRRLPLEDARQINRWKAMRRHVAQITNHCRKKDILCRRKQRQALLHWAYDSRRF